jgi:hypothetical protein
VSASVSYDGDRFKSGYDHLVEIGFHNGVVNMRTFAKSPRPLRVNGAVIDPWVATRMVEIIHDQFPEEQVHYEVKEMK